METYGAGNIPSSRLDILEVIENAVKRGVIIVNITQCNTGSVAALYKTGQVRSRKRKESKLSPSNHQVHIIQGFQKCVLVLTVLFCTC